MKMLMMMISITSPLSLQSGANSPLSALKPSHRNLINWNKSSKKIGIKEALSRRRGGRGTCRADLAQDAPFAAAIGACMLTSLVAPIPSEADDDVSGGGGGGAMDSTDARFAVMGIISFIPYFNWMSWVFAWLDSGKQRYLVYAVVYLAPYLRTNLSLSPEESWLPIASIFLCIVHIQLEGSIRNGDLNDIQIFGKALKLFSPLMKKEDVEFQNQQEFTKESNKKQVDRPSSQRNIKDFREWEAPREHVDDAQQLNENPEGDEEEN